MEFKDYFKARYLKYGFILTKSEMRQIMRANWRAARGLK